MGKQMEYENVLVEQRGSVTVLTLNRPERLNAWNNAMMFELKDAVERANADPGTSAIVFTGAGRAYCSGADMAAGRSRSPAAPPPLARRRAARTTQ